LCRAEGGANFFGVFRVKNHDFMPKNHIFSKFRGGRGLLFILLNYTSQVGNSQDPYSVSNISLLQQRQNLQVQLAALQSVSLNSGMESREIVSYANRQFSKYKLQNTIVIEIKELIQHNIK
jgi:hypothetical protein